MTIDSKVFKAILAMDSYNRGDAAGINGLADTTGTLLGNATVFRNGGGAEAQSVGFYALAYQIKDSSGNITDTVISYRGTDDEQSWANWITNDMWNGWGVGGGSPEGRQAELAIRFYQSVADLLSPTLQNYYGAPISLTGHSMGAGFAGFVGSLYGKTGIIFDNMAFEHAADRAISISNPNHADYNQELRDLLWGIGIVPSAKNINDLRGYYLSGEKLDNVLIPGNHVNQQTLDFSLNLGPYVHSQLTSEQLHSISALTIQMYADTLATNMQNWEHVASYFWPILFNDQFSAQMGISTNTTIAGELQTKGNYSDILRNIIAYSAIDVGGITLEEQKAARPFGDTGISAMYNDANDLGLVLSSGASTALNGAAADISKSFVQFAGQMALAKVLQSEHPEVLDGILKLSPDYNLFTVNFADTYWKTGDQTATINMIGRASLAGNLLTSSGSNDGIRDAMGSLWGDSSTNAFERVIFSTFESGSHDLTALITSPTKANYYVGGTGTDYVIGSNGHDLLVGGSSDDTLGGGAGNDILAGGAGNNILNGGNGFDAVVADGSEGAVFLDARNTMGDHFIKKGILGNPVNGSETYSHTDTFSPGNIEHYVLTSNNDYATFTSGSVFGVSIDGGAGSDTYFGVGTYDMRLYGLGSTAKISGVTLTSFENIIMQSGSSLIADDTRNFTLSPTAVGGITISSWLNTLDYSASTHAASFQFVTFEYSAMNEFVTINGKTHQYSSSGGAGFNVQTVIGTDFGDTVLLTTPASSYGANLGTPGINFVLGRGNDVVSIVGYSGQSIVYTGGNDIIYGAGGLMGISLASSIMSTDVSISRSGQVTTVSILNHGTLTLDYSQPASAGLYTSNQLYLANGSYFNLSNGTLSGAPWTSYYISGNEGNETLSDRSSHSTWIEGKAGNDTLIGLDGNDTLSGGTGNDTYVFALGHGNDTIQDVGNRDYDIIQLGAGITASQLRFVSTDANLKIYYSANDNVTILGQYDEARNPDWVNGIEKIVLNDGFYLDLTKGLPWTGTSAAEDIIGTNYDDTLNGLAGNDYLAGGQGDDIYFVAQGSGIDMISETSGQDEIRVTTAGITTSDIRYTTSFSSLIIYYSPTDSITIAEQYDGVTGRLSSAAVEKLILADATVIDLTKQLISTGTAGNDSLNGTSGADVIEGLGGNDAINGWRGNDVIRGGAGNDTLTGHWGNDRLEGGADNDTYIYNLGDEFDTISDVSGTDIINFGAGYVAANLTTRTSGNDLILTLSGMDVIKIESHFLGAAIESVKFSNGTIVALPAPIISGTSGNDTLTGTSSDDVIYGFAGNDTLNGGAGNDVLIGGAGADTMVGGTGNDTFVVTADTLGFVDTISDFSVAVGQQDALELRSVLQGYVHGVSLITDYIQIQNAGYNSIVMLDVDGGGNSFTTTGWIMNQNWWVIDEEALMASGQLIVSGQASGAPSSGADTIFGTSANDTINALGGNDLIYGYLGDDQLSGGDGNDLLDGGLGSDTMIGSLGNDTYIVQSTTDVVTENANEGVDLVRSTISYTLGANVENLTLLGLVEATATGNSLDNTLTGNTRNNTLNGGAGADTMVGGDGSDIYIVDNVGDVVVELANQGWDRVESDISYVLGANMEDLYLKNGGAAINGTGNSQNNYLQGNWGANTLIGGEGNDTLYGIDGTDVLYGDAGTDTLFGGLKADTFKFVNSSMGSVDIIGDYNASESDKINVADLLIGYDPLTSMITDFIEMTTSGSNTVMKVDRDGAGTTHTWTDVAVIQNVTGMTDEAALVTQGRLVAV